MDILSLDATDQLQELATLESARANYWRYRSPEWIN